MSANTFIQSTDRRTLRVQETKFLGSKAEAETYCRAMNGMCCNLTFKVITRPVETGLPLAGAARETITKIDAHFQQFA